MNLLKYAKLQTELQGKQHIRYLEDEYAKLWQMYGDLEDERDRLRKALEWYEKIVGECNRRGQEGEDARNALAQDVGSKARTALQDDRDE